MRPSDAKLKGDGHMAQDRNKGTERGTIDGPVDVRHRWVTLRRDICLDLTATSKNP